MCVCVYTLAVACWLHSQRFPYGVSSEGILPTTLHNGMQPVKQVQRWSVAERKRVMIPMPSMIGMLNTNMAGVDRLDQNVGKYCIAIQEKVVLLYSILLAEYMHE